VLIAALLACADATRLIGQDAERLRQARAGLPRADAARFDRLLRAAERRGLPTSALVDKTLEGEAKHAPPDRIIAVLQQLSGNLGRARSLLQPGPKPSAEDITAVADALRRGVPDAAVRALRAQKPGRSLSLPVLTLADLVQAGVPQRDAVALLQAWSDRGGKNNDLRDLPATIERMRHSGTLPAQAAQMLTQSMRGHDRAEGNGEHSRGRSDKTGRESGPADRPGRALSRPPTTKSPRPHH